MNFDAAIAWLSAHKAAAIAGGAALVGGLLFLHHRSKVNAASSSSTQQQGGDTGSTTGATTTGGGQYLVPYDGTGDYTSAGGSGSAYTNGTDPSVDAGLATAILGLTTALGNMQPPSATDPTTHKPVAYPGGHAGGPPRGKGPAKPPAHKPPVHKKPTKHPKKPTHPPAGHGGHTGATAKPKPVAHPVKSTHPAPHPTHAARPSPRKPAPVKKPVVHPVAKKPVHKAA